MPNYKFRDIKFYYQIHVERQKAQGYNPVSYPQFTRRLKKMNLHDAIYSGRVEYNVRNMTKSKTPIQDNIRRIKTLRDHNIQVLDLEMFQKIECKPVKKSSRVTFYKPEVKIPQPKKTIRQKFISLFKLNGKT